jgi:helicase MOV-10
VPISVVMPSPHENIKDRSSEPQLILCGDIHQLGPIITSNRAREGELDVSLLERLSARKPYSPRSTVEGRRIASLGLLQPITWLLSNYRSHPGILLLPSTLFYDDTLEPKANARIPDWNWLPNRKLPVAIRGLESEEDWVEEVGPQSWRLVQGSIADVGLRRRELPISTPRRSPRWSRLSTL